MFKRRGLCRKCHAYRCITADLNVSVVRPFDEPDLPYLKMISESCDNIHFPSDIWEKIGYDLTNHPPSLCTLAKTSSSLQSMVKFVVGHYEAHLHISFPNNENCCNEENSSKQKVEFEMILNKKTKFRRGRNHCHSIFKCKPEKIDEALDDILSIFAEEVISLRFNSFPENTNCFTIFNKYRLLKCDNISFEGSLPTHNGVYDLFNACPILNRLTISNPQEKSDFSNFWPKLKGSKVEKLDLMDIDNLYHSSNKEFKLPPSLKQLFFCPKKDKECDGATNLANILYASKWVNVYVHSDKMLNDLNSKLYKPIESIRDFSFSSNNFALNYVIKFVKNCPNLKFFNWYGLHSCVAPIVIAKFLNELPTRTIVFGGCVACKSNQTVGNGGFMEVGNRVSVVQITNFLQKPDFLESYGKLFDDVMLFEHFQNSATVMYIQKKDSHCGPNCNDIHEISQKAGILL